MSVRRVHRAWGSPTTFATTFHSGGGSLRPKSIVTTLPAVATANGGENATHDATLHVRLDGSPAFTRSTDGIWRYTQYSGGRPVKTILDAQSNHGSDFAGGDDPSGDFGITEDGNGLRHITTYAYDAQGRMDLTTLNAQTTSDKRLLKRYYSVLADQRQVALSYADHETATPTFHGPASYTVANHAGAVEASATVAISGGSTTAAATGHVNEGSADVKAAMTLGTIARLSTTVHDETGRHAEESRVYFAIPSSLPGTEGTHYDATRFGHDDSGRRWRTKAPDGTISRTQFDSIGRTVSSWTGTNDNDGQFPGGETSGTPDMVKVAQNEYDGGATNDKGPGLVTKRTLFVEGSTTGQRQTTYLYDVDHRLVLQTNPQPPHVLTRHDHAGRTVATGLYSSTSGLTATSDPTITTSTNRLALSETFHDERGQVWRTRRWQIDASNGNKGSSLDSLTWFDEAGRTVKVDGEQLAKTAYDRLGRQTRRYVLASTDDSGYADADDVAGDIVLEEHVTAYDPDDGTASMQATISRFHGDYSTGQTTGALDTNADTDDLKFTAADVKGRIQIVASWFDRFGRTTDTAVYGTYAGADFDRDPPSSPLTVPGRSDTVLVTSSTYGDDGSLKETTDPRGLVTRTEYDAAGRAVTTIANHVNGVPSSLTADDDQILRFVYANGHRTKYWVDLYPADTDGTPDSEDQVTTYTYGVAKGTSAGDSKIGSGSLLWKVQYPESSGGTDVVTYAYNAQSQEIWRKDQAGTIHESDYDTGGRRTQDRATTLGSGVDSAVRRIATTYDSSGRTELVTSHDNATPGSGSVLNEVRHAYDGWGNLTAFDMDRDSAVGGSGFYGTTHTYATATGGRNTLRRSTSTQPGGATISYNYLSTGGLHDADASRLTNMRLQIGGGSAVTVAEYRYNGVGDVVGREYPQPDVFWRQQGSSAGSYPDRDLFERIVKSRWTKDLATDIDFVSFDIAYDRSSNIVSTEDSVYPAGFDVKYALDNLNRLTDADEGTLSGGPAGSISGRTRRQQWTLTQTGNWDREKLDLNGDGDWSDADEHDETRTHNVVNEMLDRDTNSSSPAEFSQAYDAAGNLTDDGESYTYEYDAWNRLRKMRNRSTTALVAEHGYYGNGFRASEHYDTDLDGDVDGSDQTYFFAYDERWRIVAVFRGSDSDPKERFVAHAAGASGLGGSSYIDDVVLRDRDHNTAWASSSDGTLEQRRYYCQNWRHDVVALVTDDGKLAERDRYSSYGVPFGMPLGDVNGDGTTDSADLGQILVDWGTGTVRDDLDLDGDVDGTDHTIANGNYGATLGRRQLSAIGNIRSYAGYAGDSTAPSIVHVRHRVYDLTLGRWTARDPLTSAGAYTYGLGGPLGATDPLGLYDVRFKPAFIKFASTCDAPVVTSQFDIVAKSVGGAVASGWIVQKVLYIYRDTICNLDEWSEPVEEHYLEAWRVVVVNNAPVVSGCNTQTPAIDEVQFNTMSSRWDGAQLGEFKFIADGTPGAASIAAWPPGAGQRGAELAGCLPAMPLPGGIPPEWWTAAPVGGRRRAFAFSHCCMNGAACGCGLRASMEGNEGRQLSIRCWSGQPNNVCRDSVGGSTPCPSNCGTCQP